MIRLGSFILLLLSSFTFANEYRVAVEGAYPPFSQIDDKGHLFGFDVDIANALCAEMKAKCTISAQDWDGMIPALLSKKFDFLVASMSITPEREEIVAFTKPYYMTTLSMFGLDGNDTNPFKAKQEKMKIGVQKSTIAEPFVKEFFPNAEIVLYDQTYQLVMDVGSKRIDYGCVDTISLVSLDKTLLTSNKIKVYPEKQSVKVGSEVAIAIRKEEQNLQSSINKALSAIIKNGTYAKISKKYFGIDLSQDLKK